MNRLISSVVFALFRRLSDLRYEKTIIGLDEVEAGGTSGILFLPNHPALIDPIIMYSILYPVFRPRSLADRDQLDRFIIGFIARAAGARPIPAIEHHGPRARHEISRVLDECIEGLRNGENLMLYPTGHVNHEWFDDLGSNSAVETILRALPGLRVVLARTKGLWGSSFSWASGKEPTIGRSLRAGLPGLLASGLFFAPRRPVTIEFAEPDDLPRTADRHTINRYLEDFYNSRKERNTYVPYSIWEAKEHRILPEPPSRRIHGKIGDVPAQTRTIVETHLRETTGVSSIVPEARLAHDLGMDSLQRAELLLWLGKEFGFSSENVDALQTVGDVLLAASAHVTAAEPFRLRPVPAGWFAARAGSKKPFIPSGSTITEVFLKQAARRPDLPAIADQLSGVMTYRGIVRGIMALAPVISGFEGDMVGIMLPASVAATMAYLAVLFAGKTPVWINWTIGPRALEHCVSSLGVDKVVSAAKLVDTLAARDVDISCVSDKLVFIDRISSSMGLFSKISALVRSYVSWEALEKARPSPTAAILFTSGSETVPKLVPLSHENLLANIRDIVDTVEFNDDDVWLGMLPPFHSFGLTSAIILALCQGLRVVYHPNPTDGGALASIISGYGASLLVGTPTFLGGILAAADETRLRSARLALCGAERPYRSLFDDFARTCPNLRVIEGYGITECSPVISINCDQEPAPGRIGRAVPSIEWAIVDPDCKERLPAGSRGLMLVRGPSVFSGYLCYDGPSPFVRFEGKTWYRTGDLLTADDEGNLYFDGRLKRFVKIGGEMISLPAIESVLVKALSADGDKPGLAVEATPEEKRPELVLFTTTGLDREAVNRVIRDGGLSPLHNIRKIIVIDELPVLGSGKTDYRSLKLGLAADNKWKER